jgi:hypothetical protein
MTYDDPLPDVRDLLDALPEPSVRPVDVPAIYTAAALLERGCVSAPYPEARRLIRWKKLAGAAAAVAAGLFTFAFLPKVEVRFGDRPGPTQPSREDRDGERLARLEAQVRFSEAKMSRLEAQSNRVEELDAAQKELKDLLLVVAKDVNTLAESQNGSDEWRRKLIEGLAARLAEVDGRLAEVRKDNTAMYTLITDRKQ